MMQLIRRQTDRARPATLIAVIAALVVAVSIVSVVALRSGPPPVAEGDGTWVQISHDGTGPGPRGYVQVVADPTGDGLLVYGGCDNSLQCPADLWHLDVATGTWSPRTGPDVAGPAGLAYDSESRLFVTYVGVATVTGDVRDLSDLHETWTYDPVDDAWVQLMPDPHPVLSFSSHPVYDSESDRVILVGQSTQGMETWAYDTNSNTWEDVTTEPTPGYKWVHPIAYDAGSDRVVLARRPGEVWTYDYNANLWEPVEVPSQVTLGAYAGTAVYDPIRGIVVFHAGGARETGDSRLFTTWAFDYDTGTWTELAPNEAGPGAYHGMVFDELSGTIIVFGGGKQNTQGDTDEYTDELWRLTIDG